MTDKLLEAARRFTQRSPEAQGQMLADHRLQLHKVMSAFASDQIALATREMEEKLGAITRLLRDAKTLRGDGWIIRYEEHGDGGPGYYAMHDFWEGGVIGPCDTILQADAEMNKAFSKLSEGK